VVTTLLQVRAAINLAYYAKCYDKLKFKNLSSMKKGKYPGNSLIDNICANGENVW